MISRFMDWARREYDMATRLFATILAGILFVGLIPFAIIRVLPRIDTLIGIRPLSLGAGGTVLAGILIFAGFPIALWSIAWQLTRARGTPLPMMPTKELLATGPFKYCRNPMTFGTILAYMGIAIAVGSPSSIAAVVVFALFLICYLKFIEEKELQARFGQEYLLYKSSTPFIIPRILSRRP